MRSNNTVNKSSIVDDVSSPSPPLLSSEGGLATNATRPGTNSDNHSNDDNNSKQTIIPSEMTTISGVNIMSAMNDDRNGQQDDTISTSTKGHATTKTSTPTFTSATEETCSSEGAMSTRSSDNGQAYEVIEYDYDEDANIPRIENNLSTDDASELLAEVVGKTAVIAIDEDSPAAAALRANAKIHVSSVGKAARAVQLQSVRRVLKRATGITKSGKKKGKPPRIPPTLLQLQQQQQQPPPSHLNGLLPPGPIDVDQYMDAADLSDPCKSNHPSSHKHDILVEGVDEDNADDDDNDNAVDDIVNSSMTSNHDIADVAAILHQHGIDEPSFSEIGGDDDPLDMSRNSHRSHPTTTTISEWKSPPVPMNTATHGDQKGVLVTPTPIDRDMMHIPDGVAPGTVEAGKKGTVILIFYIIIYVAIAQSIEFNFFTNTFAVTYNLC
jgi:hypothetical protein